MWCLYAGESKQQQRGIYSKLSLVSLTSTSTQTSASERKGMPWITLQQAGDSRTQAGANLCHSHRIERRIAEGWSPEPCRKRANDGAHATATERKDNVNSHYSVEHWCVVIFGSSILPLPIRKDASQKSIPCPIKATKTAKCRYLLRCRTPSPYSTNRHG